jgi:hypothetical protein
MHSHSYCQRLDHLFYYLSMLGPWLLCWKRVSIRRLGYYVAPHFAPGRRGNKKPCTINMIELIRALGSTQLPESGLSPKETPS